MSSGGRPLARVEGCAFAHHPLERRVEGNGEEESSRILTEDLEVPASAVGLTAASWLVVVCGLARHILSAADDAVRQVQDDRCAPTSATTAMTRPMKRLNHPIPAV